MRSALMFIVLLAFLLGACSGEDYSPETGRIDGTFRLGGGPTPGLDELLDGSIQIVGDEQRQVPVDDDGTYTVELPPGFYELTGDPVMNIGPEGCPTVTAIVVTKERTHVEVGCFVE